MARFWEKLAKRSPDVHAQFLELQQAMLADVRLTEMRAVGGAEQINAAARNAIAAHEDRIDELAAEKAPQAEIAKTILSAVHLLGTVQATANAGDYVSRRMFPMLDSVAVQSQGFSRRAMAEFKDRVAINSHKIVGAVKTEEFDIWPDVYRVPQNQTRKGRRVTSGYTIDTLVASRLTRMLYTVTHDGEVTAEKFGRFSRYARPSGNVRFADLIEAKARGRLNPENDIRRPPRGGRWNLPWRPAKPNPSGGGNPSKLELVD